MIQGFFISGGADPDPEKRRDAYPFQNPFGTLPKPMANEAAASASDSFIHLTVPCRFGKAVYPRSDAKRQAAQPTPSLGFIPFLHPFTRKND
jgi:hypothetical protein